MRLVAYLHALQITKKILLLHTAKFFFFVNVMQILTCRNLVPNPNSSKPVTSKQVKIHDEPNIVAEALRDFGNELRNFILVNDKLKKRKPSFDSLLRRLGHLNQLTGFEVDSDVLATIKSVKTKYKKHPSGKI